MIAPGSIEEAVACARLFGRVILSAAQMRDLETAEAIAVDWREVVDLPHVLLVEAARAFVMSATVRDAPPEIVALDVLEHRRVTERATYRWPVVEAETVDAMAVRAATVWRAREVG